MDSKELIRKVRKIEIRTKGLSNQIFAGEYHSVFKGRGIAFSEVREYNYGDDIRSIDWNVTARLNHPFIKVFEEDRQLTVLLLVDVSGSGYFGTRKQFKNELIAELCAVLAFSANKNNDQVGAILFSDRIEKYIPPKKGTRHILRIIRELLDFQPMSKKTDISVALKFFYNVTKKRSIAFLLSDFLCSGFEKELNYCSHKHDMVAFRVSDPAEMLLPDIGLVQMTDPETMQVIEVDTSDERIRNEYARWLVNKYYGTEKILQKNKIDLLSIRTDESYIKALANFFNARAKRRA
jgi:uncharacterized protein (DUF58 family)